jgi:hypothetical protein
MCSFLQKFVCCASDESLVAAEINKQIEREIKKQKRDARSVLDKFACSYSAVQERAEASVAWDRRVGEKYVHQANEDHPWQWVF